MIGWDMYADNGLPSPRPNFLIDLTLSYLT